MKKQNYFLLLLIVAFGFQLNAQCGPGENQIRLELTPDVYWNEISWEVGLANASNPLYTGASLSSFAQVYEYCVPDSGCLIFSMKDSYGDGMIPDGVYRLYLNGNLIHENIGVNYGFLEQTRIGCPQGSFCDNPFYLDSTGVYTTPWLDESWYAYVAQDTGIYALSTCGLGNDCASKIWVYAQCQGIIPSDNQTGATFYADSGCDTGAVATLYLIGGKTYYFRFAYSEDSCATDPLVFELAFVEKVKGCTDPNACNYDPFATISDTCIYPGNPLCPNQPDLVVREDILKNSIVLDYLATADDCMVQEGCLKGVGERNIVRFTTWIDNIGGDDYFIGQTPGSITDTSTQFVWDPCHNHWHYRGYAEYLLYNSTTGQLVPIGSKNGFCVLDLTCPPGASGQYTCDNMGISAGCGDIYDAGLPCQWVDITDIDAGTYTLVVRVNWDKSPDKLGRYELTYDNNWAQACFTLSYTAGVPSIEVLDTNCPTYTDCTGEVFGGANVDCEGICKGVALRGDYNQDTLRNDVDWNLYLDAALADIETPTECKDLFADDLITIYDAALLQECNLHGNDPSYWGVKFACQFPTGFVNDNDLVQLLPGALNQDDKTFDVQISNPYNKILGYEFNVSGLKIASVENLSPGFDGLMRFDEGGEVLSLSGSESSIPKHTTPANLLRIHYSELTDSVVCISAITAVVNDKYQQSNAYIGMPSCVPTNFVSTKQAYQTLNVFVQPNPFRDKTTLFFANPGAEAMDVTITDLTGRVVRSFLQVRDTEVSISGAGLSAGVYIYNIKGLNGQASGKITLY